MKRAIAYILLSSVIVSSLVLASCSQQTNRSVHSEEQYQTVQMEGKKIVSVSIAKVGDYMDEIMSPHLTYENDDVDELKTFANAITDAKEINGVVDVSAPDYSIELTFEDRDVARFFVWLGADGGSIMNQKDSRKLSMLPEEIIDKLNQYLY
ncbi:hypothetical protein CEY16_05240 [Halalkalibacillus sediminis]|uniref:YhfM-like domain-containing protein n=1 Tax=Halalkalibacillus sediminis TaxID=2018042 RepID=A0A2I0QXX2_9BACI|nr:hypothetical protein [Halalkalibacillus sediminis]PKR79158.1 hypothetical protein CEY16_05240 [Halalkalibacillus sediminis]